MQSGSFAIGEAILHIWNITHILKTLSDKSLLILSTQLYSWNAKEALCGLQGSQALDSKLEWALSMLPLKICYHNGKSAWGADSIFLQMIYPVYCMHAVCWMQKYERCPSRHMGTGCWQSEVLVIMSDGCLWTLVCHRYHTCIHLITHSAMHTCT